MYVSLVLPWGGYLSNKYNTLIRKFGKPKDKTIVFIVETIFLRIVYSMKLDHIIS